MAEKQDIEYKSNWHKQYLKWICGFANAQGGTIFIGKNDVGETIGVNNYKKLMDDIPNQIQNTLGITTEVNLLKEDDKHFIEINVQPYSVPISLRGKYYYRSGSTKQELKGTALNEFLLKKSGKTWDEVIEPRATIKDIDEKTLKSFVESSKDKGRLPDTSGLSVSEILEKLRLTENGEITRAAIILFGKDPRKFYPNSFVKIGRFKNDTDIQFQEVEEGNLIALIRAVINQLNHKFLIHNIHFEGIYRVEKGEYPGPAIREMILNALIHRNYFGAPVQLRVYDDKISIWNDGELPNGITLESLKQPHSSKPRNPIIADVCFKCGLIEAWGRGTIEIIEKCKQAGLPEPKLEERDGGFLVTLFKNQFNEENLSKLGLNERQIKLFKKYKSGDAITPSEYAETHHITVRTARRDLIDLVEKQLLYKKGKKKSTKYYIR